MMDLVRMSHKTQRQPGNVSHIQTLICLLKKSKKVERFIQNGSLCFTNSSTEAIWLPRSVADSFSGTFVLKRDDITAKNKTDYNKNVYKMKKVGKQFRGSCLVFKESWKKMLFFVMTYCLFSSGEAKWCKPLRGMSSWVRKRGPNLSNIKMWRYRMNNPLIKTELNKYKRDINGTLGITICIQKTRKMLNQRTRSLNSSCTSVHRLLSCLHKRSFKIKQGSKMVH